MSNAQDKPCFFCASCGHLGIDEVGHPIGTRFECPRNKLHFAAVVKPPAGEFWLCVEARLWRLQKYSPMQLSARGGRAGKYHVIRLLCLLIACACAGPNLSVIIRVVALFVALYSLYDVLLLGTYATFVSREPAHPLRSLILNLSSVFQLATAYAVFYRLDNAAFNRPLGTLDAIYFSVVTAATVGYGDIQVLTGGIRPQIAELLIISEIILSVYMLVGLVAVVSGWANQPPTPKPVRTLEDLMKLKGAAID
jgi:hypothetical protein